MGGSFFLQCKVVDLSGFALSRCQIMLVCGIIVDDDFIWKTGFGLN